MTRSSGYRGQHVPREVAADEPGTACHQQPHQATPGRLRRRLLVDAVRADEVDHLVVDLDRLAGVAPEAVDDVVLHIAAIDVGVIDVRDLELAPPGRLERLDDVEDAGVVHVDADHGVLRRGVLGLLTDVQNAAVLDDRHAEVAQVLRILHLLEQHPCATLLTLEVLDVRRERVLQDVVAEHDQELVAVHEVLGEAKRLGDPAGLRLVRVAQAPHAELATVAEQAEELAGVIAARDDHDVVDTGVRQRLDRVVDHRLGVHRQQMLVGDASHRVEPRTGPARQNHAFHRPGILRIAADRSSVTSTCRGIWPASSRA